MTQEETPVKKRNDRRKQALTLREDFILRAHRYHRGIRKASDREFRPVLSRRQTMQSDSASLRSQPTKKRPVLLLLLLIDADPSIRLSILLYLSIYIALSILSVSLSRSTCFGLCLFSGQAGREPKSRETEGEEGEAKSRGDAAEQRGAEREGKGRTRKTEREKEEKQQAAVHLKPRFFSLTGSEPALERGRRRRRRRRGTSHRRDRGMRARTKGREGRRKEREQGQSAPRT